jgi:Fic/DOC family protein
VPTHELFSLRWAELDQRPKHFDVAPGRALVERLVTEAADSLRSEPACSPGHGRLYQAIVAGIVETYGPWASGWDWSAGEGGGGGPLSSTTWCCISHSLLPPHESDPTVTIDRIAVSLIGWWELLFDLGWRFKALNQATAHMTVEQTVEHAAVRLLPMVVERTWASDAWYGTFAVILRWFLDSRGLDPDRIRGAIDRVVVGHFESWTTPDAALAATACSELALQVAEAVQPPGPDVDSLAAWLAHRGRPFAMPPRAPLTRVARDGHREYIERFDRVRDAGRGERMVAALAACRASAGRGEPLSLELLTGWQAILLGAPAALRTTDAYAKEGRERYPIAPDIWTRFAAALDEANDLDTFVSVRAARVYLDVCFFHPFDDGNGRAARLALDHVLTRASLSLHTADPIFRIPRSAADEDGLALLARQVSQLCGSLADPWTPPVIIAPRPRRRRPGGK